MKNNKPTKEQITFIDEINISDDYEELQIMTDETVELLSKHMKRYEMNEKHKKTKFERYFMFKSLIEDNKEGEL